MDIHHLLLIIGMIAIILVFVISMRISYFELAFGGCGKGENPGSSPGGQP